MQFIKVATRMGSSCVRGIPTRTRGRHRDRAHLDFAASSQRPSRWHGSLCFWDTAEHRAAATADTEAPAAVPSLATTWAAEHTLSAKRKVVGLQPHQRQQHHRRGSFPPCCWNIRIGVTSAHAAAPGFTGEDAFRPAAAAAQQGSIGDEQYRPARAQHIIGEVAIPPRLESASSSATRRLL